MPYASGLFSKAMCPRCGHKVRYQDLVREWTGYWVCEECFDPKHEQLEPRRNVWDPQSLEHPYTDNDEDGTVATQIEDSNKLPFMHFGAKT